MSNDFAIRLRHWRGSKVQKEAASALGVPVATYRAWEYGVHEPADICRKCIYDIISKDIAAQNQAQTGQPKD